MSQINLNTATIAATVEALKHDVLGTKKWVRAADLLRADGVTSAKMAETEFRAGFIEDVVILSFTKTEQAIFAKPTNTCSDEEKVTKRWVRQQIGARLSRVTSYIKKAEDEEAMSDDDRAARRVASLESRLKRDLTKWIEKIEKAEAVSFSATNMVKTLKEAVSLLK